MSAVRFHTSFRRLRLDELELLSVCADADELDARLDALSRPAAGMLTVGFVNFVDLIHVLYK